MPPTAEKKLRRGMVALATHCVLAVPFTVTLLVASVRRRGPGQRKLAVRCLIGRVEGKGFRDIRCADIVFVCGCRGGERRGIRRRLQRLLLLIPVADINREAGHRDQKRG